MANNNTNEKRERVRKRYFWKWTGLSIALMVVIVIIICSMLNTWMASYTRHDEYVNVPELQGINDQDAIEYLEKIGLKGMVIDSVYADARPGSVVEQLPVSGLPVRYDRIVYLTVQAKSVRKVTLKDDMHDWSSRQAKSRLEELGFIVDSLRYVPNEFDDIVTNVYTTRNEHPLIVGTQYPIKTHVIIVVGSTNIVSEEQEEEVSADGGEI